MRMGFFFFKEMNTVRNSDRLNMKISCKLENDLLTPLHLRSELSSSYTRKLPVSLIFSENKVVKIYSKTTFYII